VASDSGLEGQVILDPFEAESVVSAVMDAVARCYGR
jgi:hypothetical protein